MKQHPSNQIPPCLTVQSTLLTAAGAPQWLLVWPAHHSLWPWAMHSSANDPYMSLWSVIPHVTMSPSGRLGKSEKWGVVFYGTITCMMWGGLNISNKITCMGWLFLPSKEEAGKQESSRVHLRQSQEIILRRKTGGSSSTRSPRQQVVKVQPTCYLELITQPGKLCIPGSHQNGLPPEVEQGVINMLVINQGLCDCVSISSLAFYRTFLVSTWLKTLFHWQWAIFALTSLLRGKIWCFFQDIIHSLTSGVRINTQSLRNNQPHGICLGNTITCRISKHHKS